MRVARFASSLAALVVIGGLTCVPATVQAGPICSASCRSRPNFDFHADAKVDLITTNANGDVRIQLSNGPAATTNAAVIARAEPSQH